MATNVTHDEMCDLLGLSKSTPCPGWLPYAARRTRIEVFVDGERLAVFGGAMECGRCGFGVDLRPEPTPNKGDALDRCPRCGYEGKP